VLASSAVALKPARLALIVLIGLALGLAWNAWSGRGIALSANVFVKPGDELIEAKQAKARLDQGALFLDARPIEFYRMGHIPGALPLPEEQFDEAFARLEPLLRSRFDIVVYCAGFGCEASHIVARKLKARGVPALILHEGWPAWTDAGYPTREGDAP
jgi:rhodanese-related sulfurtransferase